MTVLFTDFAFPAAGTTTERTMPTRLAEVKNVLDFGAKGDGVADDAPAIQAACNWTSGPDRGTIYFPPALANYRIASEILLNHNGPLTMVLRGEGSASRLAGNFNGFVFKRSLASAANEADIVFDRMQITNFGPGGTGSCIRLGSAKKVMLRDCTLTGFIAFTAENTDAGLSSTSVMLSSCIIAKGGNTTGSRGIIMGGGGCIEGTDLRGFDVGYRIAGSGTVIWGGRTERCNTAMEFGVGSDSQARGAASDIGAQGLALVSHTFEGHWKDLDFLGTVTGFYSNGTYMLGHDATNAGVDPGISGAQTGIHIRANKLRGAFLSAGTIGNFRTIAGVQIDDPTTRPDIVFSGFGSNQNGSTGVGWINSSKAYAARFVNCNNAPIFLFSGLPTGSDRREGDEFDISDARRASDSGAISASDWGVEVTGGGSSRVRVRWNGTLWTVAGI